MLSSENPPLDPHEISFKGVDLSIASLDDHNTIPKFSIRDYVLNTRSKDIKKNWPFSEKSLQLCLNHGVNDILPPFQCLDCLKNLSSEENSNHEVSNIVASTNFCGFESCDKHLQDTTNNPSQEIFPKKPEISKPDMIKKRKLILKVGPREGEPKTEPMAASKLCPICKTFSSSSNTKLNAHIDHCLSMDSPSSKSSIMKHRIKPRKTRLMVDIYVTAPYCTVEELDRRNGRIWSKENKKSVAFDEKGNEGIVYIDANGTKLRILNKIINSDKSSVSTLGLNYRRLACKKKKKHDKYLKLVSPKEKTSSYKTRLGSRVLGEQEKHKSVDEILKKDENTDTDVAQCSKSCEPIIKSGAIIHKWASLKRTNLLKRQLDGDQKVRTCNEIPHFSRKKCKEIDNSSSEGPIDEEPYKIPLKRSTVLKIKMKKSPLISSHFEDGFVNVEPFSWAESVIGQSLGANTGNIMSLAKSFGQNLYSIDQLDMETESDVPGNYLSTFDPITIPGPPGSFLPSPGRVNSDEDHQANSTLTTSQLQSSENNVEIINRDSSNSPKSTNSAVSNSLLSSSCLKTTENLSFNQDEIIKLGFSDEISKSTLGFQDGQPCSSGKEGISVNHQSLAPSPSSPNLILRLMGKNLMVFNSKENLNERASPSDKNKATNLDIHEYKPSFVGSNSGADPEIKNTDDWELKFFL